MTGVPIEDLSVSGFDLAFIVYPAMLSTLPIPNFWAIVFFLMLMNLGIGTHYLFIAVISELYSDVIRKHIGWLISKETVTIIIIGTILALNITVFASDAGFYWVILFDHYACTFNTMIFYTIQCIIIVYILPLNQLKSRIKSIGENFPEIYTVLLKFIAPAYGSIMSIYAIYNEIVNPFASGDPIALYIGYSLMLAPSLAALVIAIWNPIQSITKN